MSTQVRSPLTPLTETLRVGVASAHAKPRKADGHAPADRFARLESAPRTHEQHGSAIGGLKMRYVGAVQINVRLGLRCIDRQADQAPLAPLEPRGAVEAEL